MVDVATGSCRDGLHPDRANKNRGTQSVLSYLLSVVELRTTLLREGLVEPKTISVLSCVNPLSQGKERETSPIPHSQIQALHLRPDPAASLSGGSEPATEPRELNPIDKHPYRPHLERVLALGPADIG